MRTWSEINLQYCVVVVEARTFYGCRDEIPHGQYFILDECPDGQVFNIKSTELGWSERYNLTTNPPYCHIKNCTASTNETAELCNGHRGCNISQEILVYPRGGVPALCEQWRDGNYIRITYYCVSGTILLHFCILLHCVACK